MTSQEFVIWLKGFTEGVHEFNITPKQWDILKDKLAEVENEKKIGTPVGFGGWGTANHDLVNRHGNPITTSGYIARTDVPINNSASITVSTGSGGILFTTGDSIDINNLPSGSWHYTTSGGPTWYTINKIENDSREK